MKVVIDPETVEPWKLIAGGEIKVLASGTRMMAVKSRWGGGSRFQLHSHPHEQMAICLGGKAVFTIDGRDYPVNAGDVVQIPPGIQHTQRNEGAEPAVFFECFSPPREDLLRMRFEQRIYS